jgi:hypothetical protein
MVAPLAAAKAAQVAWSARGPLTRILAIAALALTVLLLPFGFAFAASPSWPAPTRPAPPNSPLLRDGWIRDPACRPAAPHRTRRRRRRRRPRYRGRTYHPQPVAGCGGAVPAARRLRRRQRGRLRPVARPPGPGHR